MALFAATLLPRDPDNGYVLRRFSTDGISWLAGESKTVPTDLATYLGTVRNGDGGPLAFSLELLSGALKPDSTFESYTETLVTSTRKDVAVKGGRDILAMHPAAPSESAAHFPGEEVVDLTDPGIDAGGQVFRASADTVHAAILRFGALGTAATEEDFESYADTAALRVEWAASDLSNSPNFLDEVVFAEGAKSMRLQLKKNVSNGDSWTQSFAPAQDWSDVTGIRFEARAEDHQEVDFALRIGDGANTATANFSLSSSLTWEEVVVPIGAFEADGASLPNFSAITSGAVVCVSCGEDGDAWIDGLKAAQDPGMVTVGIYEVDGPEPTVLGTKIGDIEVDLENVAVGLLEAQLRLEGLTYGEHYAILVSDTSNAKLFGAVQDGYESGHAFTMTGGVVTPLIGSALSFIVSSDTPAQLQHLRLCFNGDPLDAAFHTWILSCGMLRPLTYNIRVHGLQNRIIEFEDVCMENGDQLYVEVEDDATSEVTHWAAELKLRHPPFPSWM